MKRALLYSSLAIVLLYIVRELEYIGLKKNAGGEFTKLRIAFEEENDFDLVILGSSRAECQFYTPAIDSTLGLRSYNLGMTGAVMPLIKSTFDAYLVNSKVPKYVVLNLDLHSLSDNTDTVYRFPRYFAYLNNSELYKGLRERDSRFFWFRWLPVYSMPYYNNKYLSNSVRGWINQPSKYDSDYELGFAPSISDTTMGNLDTVTIIQLDANIPEVVWASFVELTELCKQKGIILIIVTSPLFHRQESAVKNYNAVFAQFQSYATQKDIPFLDLGHDSLRFNSKMYSDPAHLNKVGAKLFTRRLCPLLEQYIGQ